MREEWRPRGSKLQQKRFSSSLCKRSSEESMRTIFAGTSGNSDSAGSASTKNSSRISSVVIGITMCKVFPPWFWAGLGRRVLSSPRGLRQVITNSRTRKLSRRLARRGSEEPVRREGGRSTARSVRGAEPAGRRMPNVFATAGSRDLGLGRIPAAGRSWLASSEPAQSRQAEPREGSEGIPAGPPKGGPRRWRESPAPALGPGIRPDQVVTGRRGE